METEKINQSDNGRQCLERIPKLHPGRSGELDNTHHRRNQRIEVVFSPDELEIIDKKISNSDYKTRSQYIRKTLLLSNPVDQIELEKIQLEIYRLIAEFKKIGNNINQIAKKSNQEKQAPELEVLIQMKSDMDLVLAKVLDDIKNKVKELS